MGEQTVRHTVERGPRSFPVVVSMVVAVLVAGVAVVAVGSVASVGRFSDVGYPDSAVVFVIREFVRTGRMYLGIDTPPYLVTLYGPLTYAALSVPYRLSEAVGVSPIVGLRVAECGAVMGSAALVFAISRRLDGSKRVAWVCALFALSLPMLAEWSTQVRADFLALGCTFLGVHLFLNSRSTRTLIGAAACAGTALLFKQTFVAAPTAILLWLLFESRWKDAVRWSFGVAFAAVAGNLVALWREPAMMQHLSALRHPVFEYRGALFFVVVAVSMPGVVFGAVGMLVAARKGRGQHRLLLLYCGLAWLVATITSVQVGSSINYFWEPLFAAALFAGPGVYEIQRESARAGRLSEVVAGAACVAVMLVSTLTPTVKTLAASSEQFSAREVHRANWQLLASAVSGRRVLSTFPEVTILSASPEILDPYLNTVLERRGAWDSAPVAADIRAGAFELVIIRPGESSARARTYNAPRGIQMWSGPMWEAVTSAYVYACVFDGKELWRPRERAVSPALERLNCGT